MHKFFGAVSRRVLIYTLCTLFLTLITMSPSFAQGNRPEQAAWGGTRGNSAISRLGDRLPVVAARYNMKPGELMQALRDDFNLWLDQTGDNLVFLDEFVPQNAVSTSADCYPTAAGPFPYTQTFQLHSLPGSNRVIYLDFNGHTTSNTYWNKNFNNPSATAWGNDIVSAPFDLDGAPATFSNAEQDRIQRIWQRVAEEYAPFGVDVTTEDPGVEALRNLGGTDTTWGMRVVISPTDSFYPGAGGVAFISSYNWNVASYSGNQSPTPCFVFTNNLGPNCEKWMADAIAHEAGHTLGLQHDGVTGGATYYTGNCATCAAPSTTKAGLPDWAPIMGVGYYQSLVQWSKGEYTSANQTQDDLAVMTSSYGITYRTDDHSNTIVGATPMTVSGTTVTGKGIISTTTDVDYLSFQTAAGSVSFTITGNQRDSNLDVQARLFDASGTQILVNNPAGLSASFTTTLAAGTYYLEIDGVGTGNPLQGYYSDYGSLGEFNISGTVVAAAPTAPTAPGSLGANVVSSSQVNLSWTDMSNNETGFKVERSTDNNTWTTITTAANATSQNVTGLSANTLYYFRVRAVNGTAESANVTTTATTQSTTQQATVSEVYVSDIDHTTSKARNGTWGVTATVTVRKVGGSVVGGATVTATWSNGVTGSCKTSSTKGTCNISVSGLASTAPSVTFAVGNVSASGSTYKPTANTDPDGSSNGTTMTVAKPL
jgi:hypothetical protein